MIRAAKFVDIPRIVELLEEMCAGSKYQGRAEVSPKAARALMQQCIQRHGGAHEGASFVAVAIRDQKVEGFVVGILDRVYHVTDKLAANDVFLYCSDKAASGDFLSLLKAYRDWAVANPKVIEVRTSWTNAMATGERMGPVYDRMGFSKVGEIYELIPVHEAQEAA